MKPGQIIILNGTSSSGKSSLAKAIQQVMEDYYIHTGIDHYLYHISEKFFVFSDGQNPPEHDGLYFVVPNVKGDPVDIRIGPIGLRLWTGMHHAAVALAKCGNNLVIEDAYFDPRVLASAVQVLSETNALFVGVRCPLEVAEQREKARGDRGEGMARAHYESTHAHGIYDLEVDTSLLTPVEAAGQIKRWLENGKTPEALRRLKNLV